jgi:hypothetical protein
VLVVVWKAVVVALAARPASFGERWRRDRSWWPWREFRRTEQDSDVSYRTARLQAISLAYDDTLLLCCRLLDVPEPERPPWNPVTRLQIEAELARAGLDW